MTYVSGRFVLRDFVRRSSPRQFPVMHLVHPTMSSRDADQDLAEVEAKFFDKNITYSIMVIANMIEKNTSSRTLASFPLNISEWRVLHFISIFGPVCAADIISTLGIDKTTVSRCITSLHSSKYISLAPNPEDRRKTLVSLTKAGRAMHGKIAPIDQAADQSFENVLSKSEMASLRKITRKLRAHARALDTSG